MQETITTESRYWKTGFLILSALLLIIMPLISHDYGQSGDEWLQIEYGEHIYQYHFEGDQQALDYSNRTLQYQGIEFYGGFFDFYTEILHRAFPSIPHLYLRHFFNALFGAVLMIFTGLFAWRISGKRWQIGLIALLLIAFSPRIFGESMNNPKDIPFATGFIIAMYYMLACLQELPRRLLRNATGVGIGFLIAFGVRPAGGVLLLANLVVMTGLFYWLQPAFRERLKAENGKNLKRTLLFLVPALLAGYLLGLISWPWGLQDPLTRPLQSLKAMTNVEITLRVFFEGVFRPNNNQPWYYEFKWILMSNPVIVILGVIAFLLLFSKVRKTYGTFLFLILVFGAFFTPLYMIYKKSSVHDTWRHLFFIYPFWVCMAAIGISIIAGWVHEVKYKWLPLGITLLGLTPAIAWTVRSHPNQYVYFNEFIGGIQGAHGYYDTDYYQNTGLQAADWLLEHEKPLEGRKIIVASNMLGFDKYFRNDTAWIGAYYVRYNDRHTKEWDYYITYSRYISAEQLQNGNWPADNVVHTIEIDGVPLSAIIKRQSTAGIEANKALQANDFETAVRLYAEYLKHHPKDENAQANYGIALASTGQLDAAAAAVSMAAQLDPSRADFYQMLAQIHQARGDMQQAQQAVMQSNAIMMREQELNSR